MTQLCDSVNKRLDFKYLIFQKMREKKLGSRLLNDGSAPHVSEIECEIMDNTLYIVVIAVRNVIVDSLLFSIKFKCSAICCTGLASKQ